MSAQINASIKQHDSATGHIRGLSQRPGNYWHVQLQDPSEELFGSRAARFAFLNIWRIYIAACYPTCAYVLIPGHFACIIEVPDKESPEDLSRALYEKLSIKMKGIYSRASLHEMERHIQARQLQNIKECRECTFDLHTLPQRCHISTDYRSYPFSSYRALSSGMSSAVKRTTVLDWFGGQLRFSIFHQAYFGWKKPQYKSWGSGHARHVAGS